MRASHSVSAFQPRNRRWGALFALFCFPIFLQAQMDTATFAGRVLDPSGASVSSAMLELVDVDRDIKSVTHTNNVGFYAFPVIKPGHYRVRVSAAGFRTLLLTNLTIFTQDDIQELFILPVGSPMDAVVLKAAGVHVATSGAIGTVIEPTLISELPLNGLSFQQLFQLTPGFVTAPTSFASQGQFSVNGQRTNTNYFVIDGVAANVGIAAGIEPGQSAVGSLPALTAFGGTNSLISTEDVQEFGILTSSYSAEFGHSPGAQISIVSRSGTSQLHGNLFEFLRNNDFDANDWFANRAGLPRAALRQNDFGGVLGGPILKKGTFFFLSVEGLELRQPASAEDLVPSISARNSAPAAVKPFLDAYPLPNGPDQGNGLSEATYSFSNPSALDAESIRIDHQARATLKFFARYAHSSSGIQQRGAESNAFSTVTNADFSLQTLTAGINYSPSSHFIDDLHFNWSRSTASSNDVLDNFGGALPVSQELLFPPGFTEKNSFLQFAPTPSASNLTLGIGRNISNVQRQLELVTNISYQSETHLLKAGLDIRDLQPQLRPASYEQETVFESIASVLASAPLLTAIEANLSVEAKLKNYSAYAEDSWRPTPRVSFEYGIRWEFFPTINATGSDGSKPAAINGLNDLASVTLNPGAPLYRSRWDNFAPRLGLAYAVRNSTKTECIIRLGAGLFYDVSIGTSGDAIGTPFYPFSAQKLLASAPFPLPTIDALPPTIGGGPPFTIQAFSPSLRAPYTYQWNASVEQSLGDAQSITVSAVGALGHSLLRTEQFSSGEPDVPTSFNEILLTENSGYSTYTSLQLKFQRRARRDLRLLAAYSYAHSLDNVSTDALTDGIPTTIASPKQDYGPSDFDIRQTATIGVNYEPRVRPPKFLTELASGWSFDSIAFIRSSPPVDVTVTRSIGLGTYGFRPDLVPGVPLYLAEEGVPSGRRINSAALVIPATPQQGNLSRNFFRGFPLIQEDFATAKGFTVKNHWNVQLRVEAFNLFNHPNFGPPESSMGMVGAGGTLAAQSGFGISQSMFGSSLQTSSFGNGFSPLYQVGESRTVQLALKLRF